MYNDAYNLTTDSLTNNPTDFFGNIAGFTAGMAVAFIIFGIILLGVIIFLIVCECKIFKKAGESWWKALVPVYNTWVEAKIGGLAWWWCPIILGLSALATFQNLSYVAGIATLVVSFNFFYNISKKFGKTGGFALLITLLPFIGLPILAFGSDKYNASAETDKNGIFAVSNSIAK